MSTTTLTNTAEEAPVDLKLLSESEKKELINAETTSITSETTLGATSLSFTPAKTLLISTRGSPVLRLPTPLRELEIPIYNPDNSIAYLSTRAKRSSGNCVLTDAEGKELVATTYFFGPGKDPVLHLSDGVDGKNEIKTISRWTSRSQKFVLPDGRTFQWDYKREVGFGAQGKKGTALVLTVEGKKIAALIRNDETRTPGSKSCSAGNGGELVLSEEVGKKNGLSEHIVIATCLLMLKKEVDRRRTVQIMMITGAFAS